MLEEIKRYDAYRDKFIKNTTPNKIKIGTDGTLYNLSLSNSYGLYAKNQEELDKCDYIDKSTKLYIKDEVIAMFEELKKEIKELDTYDIERIHGLIENAYISTEVENLIQQKINKLKENINK